MPSEALIIAIDESSGTYFVKNISISRNSENTAESATPGISTDSITYPLREFQKVQLVLHGSRWTKGTAAQDRTTAE